MNIEALKEAHDLSLDGRDFAARQIILDVIADLEKKEPAGYADKIAFESAMKVGKGCDVWPVKGDYEARTGRALIALYTSPPPQRKQLTDEEIGVLYNTHLRNGGPIQRFARAIEAAHGIKGDA